MSLLAYPRAAAFGDLVRALLGAGVVLVPVAAVPTGPVVTVLALAAVAVFAALGLRAALLLCTRFEIDEAGIAALGPINRAVSWRDLRMVKLAYYSTRRDRSGGWLQLTLVDGRRRVSIDSRLDGFGRLAAIAAAAACARNLTLDPATRSNFEALGIPLEDTRWPATAR
jgi:hypothetical protein